MNHDALFKSLLKTGRLLEDFFRAFLPRVHAFIDFNHIQFVDKELFTHDRKRRTGDLLIKTRLRDKHAAFLIHLEHEAQPHRDLARRMLEYFVLDWRQFNLPVYPIAVLSHTELDQASTSPLRMSIQDDVILDFHFAVIDLARLNAQQYVRQLNAAAMALSARMRVDPATRVSFAVDFVRNPYRLTLRTEEEDEVSTFFFSYQEFRGEEGLKLQEQLSRIKDMEIPKKVLRHNPLVRFGRSEGRLEGRRREIELVLRQLNRRLGEVSQLQKQMIRNLPLKRVEALGEALLDFETSADLRGWLKSRSK